MHHKGQTTLSLHANKATVMSVSLDEGLVAKGSRTLERDHAVTRLE